MSLIATILTYAAAYGVLSICTALVLGRLLRNIGSIPVIGTPEMLEARTWRRGDYFPNRDARTSDLPGGVLT